MMFGSSDARMGRQTLFRDEFPAQEKIKAAVVGMVVPATAGFIRQAKVLLFCPSDVYFSHIGITSDRKRSQIKAEKA